jgi:hypothetical protein
MCRKLTFLILFALAVIATSVNAAVTPITDITITRVDNPDGTPNFWLESITIGSYTVTVQRLVTGTSEGVATAQPAPYNDITDADSFDLNLFAGRATENPPTHTITNFGGKSAWVNTNGNNPDFFVFETGGNQDIGIAAVLPGGTIGQSVTVATATWGNTGLSITTSGPHNGQSISGIAFAITDLLDQNGNNLTNDSVIEGIQISSDGYDPSLVCAVLAEKILFATNPSPADGSYHMDTWVTLGFSPGDSAASHDVYLSDNFDDVNDGAESAFRGNIDITFLIAGFPGNPYPDGLVAGTTYYWRVDEVNDTEPNSPWLGDVWSFTIPPKTAYSPDPADGAESVDLNVRLSWTAGLGTKLHYIVIGEDFDEVNNAATGTPNGTTNYSPGQLKLAKTYYWRVDEFDGIETHKGDIWSFTTEGAVSSPNPEDGAVDVSPTQILTWDAGAVAASHEVYFGADAEAVKNATTASPEYKGPKALGEESYDPGKLMLNTTYYWRIDEVNGVNPDSPWAGNVWSLTTGNFLVIDDFESYDVGNNEIWWSWKDGLGYVAHGNEPAYPGNGTGAAVGDETTASYTEETIVHGGNQSMPFFYDNNKQGYANYSEAELTLTEQRNWTEQDVAELSIWFRGNPASVGSFVESPVGTYTMTASGVDIWNQADEFHFAYKMLSGVGSIVARVESVEQTDVWAKAGVMIRETLDAGSKFAAVYITPTNPDGTATNGCRFQARTDTDIAATSDTSVATAEQTAIVALYWVKLERDITGNFRAYYSSNGTNWTSMSWNPQFITMSSNVYIGLALTSHNANATCQAVFSNVTTTGNVSGQWTNQDIGIASNANEPLYVAVSNRTGTPAVVVHEDANAATIDTWTEWVIPLSIFADQGIVLTDVDKIAIGLGTKGNMTIPGGSGKMYIDDIRLYQPRTAP